MTGQPFLLGVNYWPARKAMYWWKRFDPREVHQDFSLIRDLGLSMVRIFLLWEDFQPEPEQISSRALADLGKVCETAASLDLKLDVTFFVGHMSGPNWVPSWMLRKDLPMPEGVRQVISAGQVVDCGYANIFSDPDLIQAETFLLEEIVRNFKDHPGIGIWNLGNEPDLFARPSSPQQGWSWIRRMVQVIKAIDPVHPITCGLHVPDLIEDNGLHASDLFGETDLAVIHGYPMYHDWASDPLDLDFLPYLCWLTSALCAKPVILEEFGGPTASPGMPSTEWKWKSYGKWREQFVASEQDFARFIEQTLESLLDVGALGAFIWCFADYTPELYHLPPCDESRHERYFGLIRPDGTKKPHAEVIRRFAATHPRVKKPVVKPALDLSPASYYQAPLENAVRLYQSFRKSRSLA